ncbi:MAG: rhodanese-like domain-containing protein [Gammaproteobacteria bacterium]|nr:MAG: rhodanese-like domain-containing protein [Gammaproteobacteria bacterium]
MTATARVLMMAALVLAAVGSAQAAEVKITPDRSYVLVEHEGRVVRIQRIQDLNHKITGSFARTSRKCPPFCIQPMHPAPGIETIGELELIDFMEHKLPDHEGYLIDARLPSWHRKGTIPGSINIPFTTFEKQPDDLEVIEALELLGARQREGGNLAESLRGWLAGGQMTDYWDFTDAKPVVLWCNGPWCGQSPRAIRALLKLGYPADKIKYYRGGMQMWQLFGLTTVVPGKAED